MLEEEIWIEQLAETTQLDYNTSYLIWQAFCQQLEQRLITSSAIYIPNIGVWSLVKEDEYIALLPSGDRILIPPRLHLEIVPLIEQPDNISIYFFAEALSIHTGISLNIIQNYLEQIPSLWLAYKTKEESIIWKGIGKFFQNQGNYVLSIDTTLEENLNRPFSIFSSLTLSQGEEITGLPILTRENNPANLIIIPSKEANFSYSVDDKEPLRHPIEEHIDTTKDTQPIEISEEKNGDSEHDLQTITITDKPSSHSWIYTMAILLIAILIGGIYLYQGQRNKSIPPLSVKKEIPIGVTPSSSLVDTQDSRPQSSADTIQMSKGMTLTKYALAKYGHKIFWVYIYEENQDRIQDPNNIPLGTELILPTQEKYQINASDSTSLAIALEKQRILLSLYH